MSQSEFPSSPQTCLTRLLEWCACNSIWIDPRLEIRCDAETGVAVYAKDFEIPPNTSLVHIHKNSVLSVRSCTLSPYIEPVLSGPTAQLSLSLALYTEVLCGKNSRWFAYLRSLPRTPIPIPLLWSDGGNRHDGEEGLKWLQGTEVERYLTEHPYQSLESIDTYYFTVAEPLFRRQFEQDNTIWVEKPTLNGFCHAYALVSSRAFLVDAYHGLSMVPIADAFNHAQDNHVHLETEFNVCVHCGSLHECTHDIDDVPYPSLGHLRFPKHQAVPSTEDNKLDSYYEVVSNVVIVPNEEIFNTYGEALTNAQLLAQYGFVLDVNENDKLHWKLKEVYTRYVDQFRTPFSNILDLESVCSEILLNVAKGETLQRVSDSSLIYFNAGTGVSNLCLDSDGRVSLQLWIALALLCLDLNGDDNDTLLGHTTSYLEALLEYQLAVEGVDEMSNELADVCQRFSSKQSVAMFVELGRSLISLCVVRKSRLGKGNQDTGTLNEVLDMLPSDMPRTRDALTIVMGELSILDSCISTWDEMTSLVSR